MSNENNFARDTGAGIETTESKTVTVETPGIFSRAWAAMSRNPVTTAVVSGTVGAAAVAGAGYGLYVKARDGEDLGDSVETVGNLVSGFFG